MDIVACLNQGIDPRLILASGVSGIGKTTWCRAQVLRASQAGCTVGGLLSPGVYHQGEKVGIDLLDFSTGESRLLAELRPQELTNVPTRKWSMQADTLAWGNQLLQGMGYYDMVVIDELGPLEFLHHQGLLQAFDLVERRKYKTALVVVRPSLLELARGTWSEFDIKVHMLSL
jgi:nucleoside-triphosphatase THEP1